MYIHYSRRMVLANAPPFTCLLVTPKQHNSLKTNTQKDLGKGGESWCDVGGSFQSQITRTITIHFLPFTANGSLITPITFTYSLQSRELWPQDRQETFWAPSTILFLKHVWNHQKPQKKHYCALKENRPINVYAYNRVVLRGSSSKKKTIESICLIWSRIWFVALFLHFQGSC